MLFLVLNTMTSGKNDRLQLALRASKEGIWDWDLKAGTIDYSIRALRFLGCRKDDAPNIFIKGSGLLDEESMKAVEEALRRVNDEGEDLFAVEPKITTRQGLARWFRIRGTPVRDDEGQVIRIAGSMIEITKRKKAEHELAEERFLIQNLLDNIPMNIYFKDEESRFVMANRSTAKKMGLESPDELVGKSDADFFSPGHAAPAREMELAMMATGEPVLDLTEHEIWTDRDDTWVKSTKYPWLGTDGKIKGTFGVTTDISELIRIRNQHEEIAKQLNKQNRLITEEREMLRLVIDSVPLQVYFKDCDHRFVIANEAMTKRFGCESPRQLYERSDRDLFSEEHWAKTERDEKQIMETGEPIVDLVERESFMDGRIAYVISSKYPWRDHEGKTMGTFGVSTDVSDLISAQQILRASAEEFDRKNAEMAGELALAREVQLALLADTFPTVKFQNRELNFHRLYRPAENLTGEFYEIIPLSEGRGGFLMGEVMGEGVRSALIVSMLRGLIEKERESAGDSGRFLTSLNEGLAHLFENSDLEIQVTAFYGVVDLVANTIQMSVAGHLNPIAVFDDGVRQLSPPDEACGSGLGVDGAKVYGRVVARLDGLRRMFCFTNSILKGKGGDYDSTMINEVIEVIERGGKIPNLLERLAETLKSRKNQALCMLAWELKK